MRFQLQILMSLYISLMYHFSHTDFKIFLGTVGDIYLHLKENGT